MVRSPCLKILEIPGGRGGRQRPSGTEIPGGWGVQIKESSVVGDPGYGYFLEPHIGILICNFSFNDTQVGCFSPILSMHMELILLTCVSSFKFIFLPQKKIVTSETENYKIKLTPCIMLT